MIFYIVCLRLVGGWREICILMEIFEVILKDRKSGGDLYIYIFYLGKVEILVIRCRFKIIKIDLDDCSVGE